MSADDAEVTWYHGTRRGFGRGGYVTPRDFHAGAATTAPTTPGMAPAADSDQFTYLTTSRTLAWVYAWHAVGRGKPKVLTVSPMGEVTPDPEHGPDMEAYRCAGWLRVLSVDTTPEMTEEEARSGWMTADWWAEHLAPTATPQEIPQ